MNPNDIDTGKRKLVKFRSSQPKEPSGFTLWLPDDEHIACRGAVLGIELELEKARPGLPVSWWRKRK